MAVEILKEEIEKIFDLAELTGYDYLLLYSVIYNGMSQVKFAKICGVTPQSINYRLKRLTKRIGFIACCRFGGVY